MIHHDTGSAEWHETVTRLNHGSHTAGYEVMDAADGILSIILNREQVPLERLRSIRSEDFEALYDRFIGPAVDDLETHLLGDADPPQSTGPVTRKDWFDGPWQVTAVADTLQDSLRIVLDRRKVPAQRLQAITADDLDTVYNQHLGWLLNTIDDQLLGGQVGRPDPPSWEQIDPPNRPNPPTERPGPAGPAIHI